MFGDLESPGTLGDAAQRLATPHRELLLMTTGPDLTSMQMLNNSLLQLEKLGLRRHVLVIADSMTSCEALAPPCFWSSRVLINAPSESVVNTRCEALFEAFPAHAHPKSQTQLTVALNAPQILGLEVQVLHVLYKEALHREPRACWIRGAAGRHGHDLVARPTASPARDERNSCVWARVSGFL